MIAKKRPWMKFYPADWRADPRLRSCSLGARGLWADMLALMHEADPYGSLLVNGAPVNDRQLAALVGAPARDVRVCLAELEGAGVFSRDGEIIFSRRMRRDFEKAERDKANGAKGGNPSVKGGVNPPVKGEDKAHKPEARDQKDTARLTREPLVSDEAWALAGEVAAIAGYNSEPKDWPPGWAGSPMQVQCWLNGGWLPDAIRAGARAAAPRKTPGTIKNIKYFEGAIADEIARLSQPLPQGDASNGKTSDAKPRSRTSFQQSKDEFRDARAKLKAFVNSTS